jgi:hypothetical protein
MTVGVITKYNQMAKILQEDANPDWDDSTAGAFMFILATSSYTPSVSHTTVNDIGANYIDSGDGAPINATTRDVIESSGDVFLDSDDADFGSSVTITAKYLVCVMPVSAGTVASTSKLVWYVDLNTGGGSIARTNSTFKVVAPVNGWTKYT